MPGRSALAPLALGTLASRVLGLLRDMLVAALLGPAADAFVLAFRLPNFFRRLLAEGSLGMAFAAAQARVRASAGREAAFSFSRTAMVRVFYASAFCCLLIVPLTPWLARLLAPGADTHIQARGAELMRLCLPYLPCALAAAVAYAHAAGEGRFRPQAWAAALLNLTIMACAGVAFLWRPGSGTAQIALCLGVSLGGVVQLLLGLACFRNRTGSFLNLGTAGSRPGFIDHAHCRARPSSRRQTEVVAPAIPVSREQEPGINIHPAGAGLSVSDPEPAGPAEPPQAASPSPHDSHYGDVIRQPTLDQGGRERAANSVRPGVRAFLAALPGSALGAAPHQLHILAGMVLASFLGPGGISALYFAERLVELPVGLAGAVLGMAVMPGLARQAAKGDLRGLSESMHASIRLSAFLSLPAAAGLFSLAGPIAGLLFGHGTFATGNATLTASALRGYALALPALCMVRPLLAAANALGQAGATLRSALVSACACLGIGALSLLAWSDQQTAALGVGLGLAGGAWVNLWLLRRYLKPRLGGMDAARATQAEGASAPQDHGKPRQHRIGSFPGIPAYVVAALVMGGCLWPLGRIEGGPNALSLVLLIGGCVLLWMGFFAWRKSDEARLLLGLFRPSGKP